MLELHLLTTDGKAWVSVDDVREALDIKKDENISLAIKKLREERERYKSNCDYFAGIAQDRLRDRNKLELGLREALGTVDEYADILGLVRKLKQERDELKEKQSVEDARCEFLRELSCSLGFGNPVVKPDNIDQKEKDILERVEKLKVGVWPCENTSTFAEFLRKEFPKFCERYNVVPLTSASIHDWITYIFDVLSDYRGMHDSEWNRIEELKKEKHAVEDSLAELRAKIREIYRSVVDDEWPDHFSYTSAMNDINEEYKRIVHNFEERTADWSKAQQEYSRYRLAVGSLLDIPKETRGDINAIERAFTFSKKQYESLQEFRDSVCEMFDIPSNMADNYVLKEIHDVVDRYDELEDFRADICGALDIEGMMGTPQQNDKYILEQVEKMKGDGCDSEKEFLDGVKQRIGVSADCSDSKYMLRLLDIKLDHSSLSAFTDSVYEELGISRYGCTLSEAVDELKKRLDRSARLRSNICTALCLGHEDCDGNIIGRIHMMQDCHEKLCKDYTELRKAIWEAMGKISETQPGDDERLVGEVAELKHGEKLLIEFRDDVAKAIGIEYPAANNVILNNVKYICKDRKDAYDMVAKLNDYVTALEKAREDLQQMLKDILGIDSCEKDTVVSAIKALKSVYNSLRNDYDEVCEGYTKLKKDYDNLGEAYSSILKWNNSYADVRRLLGISADADAGEMVGALNKLVCDYEKLKKEYEKAKCNTNYFVEFEKSCRERQAFIVKLCEALDIDTEDIGSFFDDEETAILKAIEEHHEATASIDQLRQKWHDRYESEHERANGEHKRAEKLNKEVRDWTIRCNSAERALNARGNEDVALTAFKNEIRKLKDEKDKVIEALGQDIWDDCLK